MHSTPPFPPPTSARGGLPSVAAAGRAIATPLPRLLTPSFALELGILLVLSVLLPFLIHVLPVPEDARLGPRLLPIFYAPLLATLFGRKHSAVAVAALAPWLNWLVTGYPRPQTAWLTMVELLVFVLALRRMLAWGRVHSFVALPAYLVAIAVATAVAAVHPALIGGRAPAAWAWQSVTVALPGIAVLVLINWLAVRAYPTGGDGNGPAAA